MKLYAQRLFIVFCFLLNACATAYQPLDNNGAGFADQKVAENVYLVSFVGNGSTSPERVRDFALLHAAQITTSRGYRYFMVDDKKAGTYFKRPTPCEYTRVAPPNEMSGQLFITNDPTYSKFNAIVLDVHLLHGMPEGSSDSIFDAYKVMHTMDVKYSLAISANSEIAPSKSRSNSRQQCK